MSWRLSHALSRGIRAISFSFVAAAVCPPALYPQSPPPGWTERVDRAIRTGRDALAPRLDPLVEDPRSDYPVGRISFVLTALLESGLSLEAPALRRALDRLSRLEPTKTYCVATYLLLLGTLLERLETEQGAAAVDAVGEELVAGEERRPEKEQAPLPSEAEIRARMKDLAEWLVSARTKGRGTWTYEVAGRSRRHDFSNTQFAVLGLHVAMKHGIPVPPEVFAEIVRVFSDSIRLDADPVQLTYRPAMRFEALLGLEARPAERRISARPGGWAYRATAGADGDPPYPAMTAAGASSVVVAVKALRRAKNPRWGRIAARGERTLHHSYAWIEKHFEDFTADGRNLHYTLYSLEKVGDLGEVASFGAHDWYAEGARRLLEKQRGNGSWGGYVDTAFALLFLTRATRSTDAAAAPTLVTRGGSGGEGQTEAVDLVYIERANGFLSARHLLRYMSETRDPRLVEIGREVVANYDPARREDLIPHLLALWNEPGRLRSFTRRALKEITGESFRSERDARRWYEQLLEIGRFDGEPAIDTTEVAKRLRSMESPALRAKLVRLARRRGLRDLRDELTLELSRTAGVRTDAAASYRRLVHGLLGLWTGAEIPMPRNDDVKGWESTAKEWRRWLRRNG